MAKVKDGNWIAHCLYFSAGQFLVARPS